MRKLLLTAVAALFTAALLPLSASAQITIDKKGHSQFGSIGTYYTNWNGVQVPTTVKPDTTANIVILGPSSYNMGGKISFGDESHAWIGETRYNDFITIGGDLGIEYRMGNTTCFYAKKSSIVTTTLPEFIFNTSIRATAFNTSSDLRLKKDVTSLGDSYLQLADVNSISYRLLPKPVPAAENEEESMSQPAIPDERVHFGFAAQEIQEIFPELVSEDEEGYLSIDYTGFIPLLVDAYKNLAARNEELEAKVEGLLNPARKTVAGSDGVSMETVTLSQNRPNPFTESTIIDITLPSDVSSAMLCIYDMQGTQVMQLPVEGRGKTAVTVDGKSLHAGMYLYSLIVDGEEVATKRMILTE